MSSEKQISEIAKVIHESDKNDNNIFPMSLSDCLVMHGGTRTNAAVALYNAGYCLTSETADKIFSEIENTLKDCLWFLENHTSNYPTMDRTKIKVYKDTLSYLAELKKKYVKSEET